jgi:hypothetical protein
VNAVPLQVIGEGLNCSADRAEELLAAVASVEVDPGVCLGLLLPPAFPLRPGTAR